MPKKSKTALLIEGINKVEEFNPSELLITIEDQRHLPVKDRISWFKLLHPSGSIRVGEPTYLPDIKAYNVHAEIYDENNKFLSAGNGTAAYHEMDDFGKHPVECAETKAIGRALAAAGFGNQFSGNDFVQAEPIDAGIPIKNSPENIEGDLFGTEESECTEEEKLKKFEAQVSKVMKTYTPEMSKGILITYGPHKGQSLAEIYKALPAENKMDVLEEYAYPKKADMEHAAQIAACRVFVETLKNLKK